MLCDFSSEIISFDYGMVYFWDEDEQKMHLRVTRSVVEMDSETYERGNVLNLWAAKHARPLLITLGQSAQADVALRAMDCQSALVIPLFVSNRVLGSMQFFGRDADSFTREDAQLLWILALVSENLLTRITPTKDCCVTPSPIS
jgi:transcriptional regulator with GAF, ATPase, and Fis domain